MRIRKILLAAPLVVVGVFAAAFLIARPYFGQVLPQLTIASIGEPERLNPLLSTTAAASEVEGFVFDALIRLTENIELEPAMAESFELSQVSRLYMDSPEMAQRTADELNSHKGQWWKDASIESIEAEGDAVVLHLSAKGAGTAYQDVLFKQVPQRVFAKVQRWAAQIDNEGLPEDKHIKSDAVIAWLEKNRAAEPVKPRVLYGWRNTSTTFEIYTVGADGAFVEDLYRRMGKDLGWQVKTAEAGAAEPARPPATETQPATAPATAPAGPAVPENMRLHVKGPVAVQFDKEWIAQDEPQILFTLRKGITWHDGAPFTSADVEFTYNALMDERVASPRRSDFELIRQVHVPDDYTVRVVYKEPYSPCLYSWGTPIIPKHILARETDIRNPLKSDFDARPIGTGSFKFESWATGQQITLVRNDQYWEGRPHFERVVYRIIPDPTAKQLEFQTGGWDVDLGYGVDPHQTKRFEADPRFAMYPREENRYNYIGWNLNRPLFQDKKVRQALAHAVNMPQIIQYIMYGYGKPCNGPYSPVTPWWNPNIEPIPYDPQKARQLLAEAGWKDTDGDGILDKDGKPFRFGLITNNGNQIRRDISVLVQNDLRKIGIQVDVAEYEWAVFIQRYIVPRNFDACVLGWVLSLDQDPYQIWHSSMADVPNSLNHVSYKNPEVDRLIERARTEFDMTKIKQATYRISELIYGDQPYLFLFYPTSNYALAKDRFAVRRPGPDGTWIEEPVRKTKLGHMYYLGWWYRQIQPTMTQ